MEFKISIRGVDLIGSIEMPSLVKAYVALIYEGDAKALPCENELFNVLVSKGIAVVRCDLLRNEEKLELKKTEKVNLLTERFIALSRWCQEDVRFKGLKQGYLGTGLGAAAALSASAYWGTKVAAVVSWNGSPDLAMEELDLVESPVLLLVRNGDEKQFLANKQSYQKMGCVKKLEVLMDESKSCEVAAAWFDKYLRSVII